MSLRSIRIIWKTVRGLKGDAGITTLPVQLSSQFINSTLQSLYSPAYLTDSQLTDGLTLTAWGVVTSDSSLQFSPGIGVTPRPVKRSELLSCTSLSVPSTTHRLLLQYNSVSHIWHLLNSKD